MSNWDVSNVMDMSGMFEGASNFNGDIGSWDVSNVTDMSDMFDMASIFNQDISNWDVSSVTIMEGMFADTTAFNQDIGNWDVSKVTDMEGIFSDATAFNQDISDWNVSKVSNMTDVFQNATAFNQDLSDWDISSVRSMTQMFDDSGMSQSNLDATLEGWADINISTGEAGLQSGVNLGVSGLSYADVTTVQYLADEYSWSLGGTVLTSGTVTIDGVSYTATTAGSNTAGDSLDLSNTPVTGSQGFYVHGLGGDDTITGSANADRLVGGAGDDTLSGGATATTDGGADIFVFQYQDSGTDTITDFDISEGGDKLDISILLDGYGETGYGTALSDFLSVTNTDVDDDGKTDTRIEIDPDGTNTATTPATQVIIILDDVVTSLATLQANNSIILT